MKTLLLTILMTSNLYASEVDLKQTSFTWKGTKASGEHIGNLSLTSAKLEKGKNGSVASGEFVIDMNSVTTTDLSGEWKDKFLGHIKSPDFLDVAKFPTAKLIISGDDGKNLTGKLTIKGKTNDIKVPYQLKDGVYSGTMTFDRTKFDMKYGSGNFFKDLGDKLIHDQVTVGFNVKTK